VFNAVVAKANIATDQHRGLGPSHRHKIFSKHQATLLSHLNIAFSLSLRITRSYTSRISPTAIRTCFPIRNAFNLTAGRPGKVSKFLWKAFSSSPDFLLTSAHQGTRMECCPLSWHLKRCRSLKELIFFLFSN